jgi:hypothetical protein
MKIFIFLIILTNFLLGNNFKVKNTNDIDFIFSQKKISKKYPLILIFDSGTHGKKVTSIIKKTFLNKKITFPKGNIVFINRIFKVDDELNNIEIISYISKKFNNQQIFINMSYGYNFKLQSTKNSKKV